MKVKTKEKLKMVTRITMAMLSVTFIVLSVIAKIKKRSSVYDDEPKQKNPMEGKSVQFIKDDKDKENADGVKGHLIEVEQRPVRKTIYDSYIKRGLDIIFSFGGLVILSPIYAVIAVIIKIDDPGPVFFTQKRVGKNKQYFKLHKFRSMKLSTPHDVPTHMLENPDQYITRIGKFLRKSSLDELPQIWDIFIGNMSIVGPRPALWNQDCLISLRDRYDANDVKPGLTGWAQINGRDELKLDDKAKLDGEYVKKQSLLFDIKCFLGTIKSVVKSDGIVEGGASELDKDESRNRKKSILVICQYYYPEPFRIKDICEELVQRGYEVQVVTGYPNYPEGILYDGYGKEKRVDEIINGVKVHRCFTVPRETGTVKRMMNYYSYAFSSVQYVLSKKCINSDGKPFDIIFCNQLSPVMMGYAAIAYKKKYHIPAIMYCLDLWPESLIAGGITRNSIIYKYCHNVSARIYKQMDKILIASRMFANYLENEFHIEKNKIDYLPQYAENIFEEIPQKEVNGIFDFMFAGNIGKIQSVETILEAAKKLHNYPVRFHIIGGGTDLERLKSIKESNRLKNVIFYGRKLLEEMPYFYAKADAMLVTLKSDPILSLTLPGKVQSYMAVGKPIIGAINGEAKIVIEEAKCGYCGEAENADELVENIKKFIFECNRKEMGINARKYYENNFESNIFFNGVESKILDI